MHRLGARTALRRFRRDETGATAVEFGLIALPFFALLFAILETALLFLAGQSLENAVDDSVRLIRTGQAQQNGMSANSFRAQVCSEMTLLISCVENLRIDVRTYETFDSMNIPTPIDADGNLKYDDFIYDAGHGGDIVVVRAYYEWPTFSKLLGLDFSNLSDGNHLLGATAAFKNEPFPW